MEKLKTWLKETLWPRLRGIASEWWESIGEKPVPHLVSMVNGMALYVIIKTAVRIAA